MRMIFAEGEEAWRQEIESRRIAMAAHREIYGTEILKYPECMKIVEDHRANTLDLINRPNKVAELGHEMARWVRYAAPAEWGRMEEKGRTLFPYIRPDEIGPYTWGHAMAGAEAERIENGRKWWVGASTVATAEKAAKKLPRYRLTVDDLPSRKGLLILSKTLPLPIDKRTTLYRADDADLEIAGITWSDGYDMTSDRWGLEGSPAIWVTVWGVPQDLRPLEEAGVPHSSLENFAMQSAACPLTYDREMLLPLVSEWIDWPEERHAGTEWVARMFLTICKVIQSEKLTEKKTVKPDPRSRLTKSQRKKGTPLPDVRVVNIRGTGLGKAGSENSAGGETGRSYSVWRPVAPYPKWVYYPSRDEYELKLIEGHQRRATNRPDVETVYKVE